MYCDKAAYVCLHIYVLNVVLITDVCAVMCQCATPNGAPQIADVIAPSFMHSVHTYVFKARNTTAVSALHFTT